VDKPAVLANADSIDPKYPPELFAGGVTGSVLAEFVVDSTGRVEEETVTIVSSTNSLFSATVLRSLQAARYVPAMKDGRAVRQAVQQPFKFTPPGQRKPAPAGK
jgi:protein TonB